MQFRGAVHFAERVNAHFTRRIPIKRLPSRLTRSVVSFTFDDFPKSAWSAGGPILAKYGAVATYFVAGVFCGATIDGLEYYDESDLKSLHANGHEIGSHGFAHRNVRRFPSRMLLEDVAKNEDFIRTCIGDVVPTTFAYPFGETSLRTKALFGRRFACCRGGEFGLNRDALDLGQLSVVSLESRLWTPAAIDSCVAQALRTPSWIIFVTHEIEDNPRPWGSTHAMLDQTLAKCRDAKLEIMTVKDALALACF